jgi:hypothetical protein
MMLLAIGVAMLATGAAAESPRAAASQAPQQSAAPWYERFTFGSETASSATRWVPRSDNLVSVPLSSRSRWGVTLGVTPQQRTPGAAGSDTSKVSAGAYYQLSPRVRVGGAVNLPSAPREQEKQDPTAEGPGVRFESAFRF